MRISNLAYQNVTIFPRLTILQNGAAQINKGRYVVIPSIAFLDQLKYILNYWTGEDFEVHGQTQRESIIYVAYELVKSFD